MTDIDTAELRRLLEASWPDEWKVEPHGKPEERRAHIRSDGRNIAYAARQEIDLIVAAINALPGLLDEIERLRGELATEGKKFSTEFSRGMDLDTELIDVKIERDALATKLARVEAELRISHPYPQEDRIRRHYPPLIARLFGILDEEEG